MLNSIKTIQSNVYYSLCGMSDKKDYKMLQQYAKTTWYKI